MASKIIQIPVNTTAERNALVSPPNGSMVAHQETMGIEFTWNGGSTWIKMADGLNSSPRTIVYVSNDGDDTVGTGKISSPFKTLSHAADTILTSSFTDPFEILMASGNYIETGIVDVPPGVTINGGGSILNFSGGTLQLRAAAWNGITDGFFNIGNFEKLSLPDCNLDLSNTIGFTTISIFNIVPFNNNPTITISGSSTSYSNIFLQDIPEGDTQIFFNLNNANIFINSVNFANTVITFDQSLGYQIQIRNSINNNIFDVNVDGALSAAVIQCSGVNFLSSPSFIASNGGDINYSQNSCTGGAATFENAGGTLTAELQTINIAPILIGTPTVNYNIIYGSTLSLKGSSGLQMAIDNGQWNMDMTTGGNPSTWQMSSDFNINFPYGGGTFNVITPDDINLTSTAGSVTILADSGTIAVGSPATALVSMLVQNIQVGDYSGAGTTSVVLSGGSVSANTAGAPFFTLDGGSENTSLGGANTTISGNNIALLESSAGNVNLSALVDVNIETQPSGNAGAVNITTGKGDGTANAINIKTDPVDGSGGPITIQSTLSNINISAGADMVINALSGSIGFNSGGLGFFGEAPVSQSAPIADASVLLTDVVSKFNTLLAYLRSRGDIDT